jgi:hypothetical protein
MNCFNHQESDAVGVCRNCSKMICRECLFFSELPVGVVCSEYCFEKVTWLINILEENEQLKPRYEEDRRRYVELSERNENRDSRILAENDHLKEKNTQLYANLSRQEKRGGFLCAILSAGLLGYGGIYTHFFDWYFCIGLGTILFVFSFNAFNRSDVYKKYAGDN